MSCRARPVVQLFYWKQGLVEKTRTPGYYSDGDIGIYSEFQLKKRTIQRRIFLTSGGLPSSMQGILKETGDDAVIVTDAVLNQHKGFQHAMKACMTAAQELADAGITTTLGLIRDNASETDDFREHL